MWVFEKQTKIDKNTTETRESYEVGFYDPNGYFIGMYEFTERVDAAQKVHFLNGGD